MSRPFKLFRLQQVDSQLDLVNVRLTEIEEILGQDEVLQDAKEVLENAQEAQSAAEKDMRRAEEEVKAQQIKIEQNQSTLYSGTVSNPKELQDLQTEADSLNRQLASLEDVQLEKMLTSESMQSEEKLSQKSLHEIEVDREKEHGKLSVEQKTLEDERSRLENERAAAATGIDESDINAYLKLRTSKNGLAVAKVKGDTCSACGTQLSHALAQAARSPNDINPCSTCKRILYAG